MTSDATTLPRPARTDPALAAQIPTFDELMARAATLSTVVRARARQTEHDRRVSPEITDMLREAGLYRALQPKRFGGYELSIEELRSLAFEIGRGCTSTGWCYGLSAAMSWVVGMFPDQAQHDVWGEDPGAVVASCIAPTGKIHSVDGGYKFQGRWSFGSNSDNASWLALGGMLSAGDEQPPRPMFLLVPEGQYRIVDNWHTVGLAGTGSKDIVIEEEIFVPAHRSVSFAEVLEQQSPGALVNPSPIYRIPFLSGFPPMLANPAVAALRGAIDEFVDSVAARTTRGAFVGGGNTIGNFGHVQSAVAEAEAAVDAAQLILQRDLRVVSDMAACGSKPGTEQRIEFRRGHAYAVKLCVAGINGLFDAVGGTGINLDNGVQRAWRDIHAVAHHISVNWNAVSTMYGQMRLGLPPRGQY